MGLFSFLGKVAKTGLSLATGGKSDAVLKALGKVTGLTGKPKRAALAAVPDTTPTIQERAFLNKAIEHTPKVKRTENVEGWSFGKARGGFKRKRAAKVKRMPRAVDRMTVAQLVAEGATDTNAEELYRRGYDVYGKRLKKGPRKPAKARSARKAPSGGLDLARIAQMWRAAGKPGAWRDFIKANTHIRKA